MSQARRRLRDQDTPLGDAVVESIPDWDDEAIIHAREQARMLEVADPDAALRLRAMADAAEKRNGRSSQIYDPMNLYARVLKFYGGGITDQDLQKMDYRRFWGYVREANILAEEEKAAYEKVNSNSGQLTIDDLPRTSAYQGETIRLI